MPDIPIQDIVSPGDTFKILIATDNHLGYQEKDEIRCQDSFNSFEEVMSLAQSHKVDMVLLGGDLFHENKPSGAVMYKCLNILRNYCMGDKPVEMQFLSDPTINFPDSCFPTVNYEDPNVNISIPVFSIHGNHDDPAGTASLCALDIISQTGLINFFGKVTNLEKIEIRPILLQKGATKLALYGLGSIKDERLHRLFEERNVKFLRPRENQNDWFNLLAFHQNRAKRGPKNYIPEQFLDNFLDFVLWGHEHDCHKEPEWNAKENFYVLQPGSSVATSLIEGEAIPKHCGILEVNRKQFKWLPLELKTVRQFYIESISLKESGLNSEAFDIEKQVLEYCQEKVDMLIAKAQLDHSGNRNQPQLPLIRLKVDFTGGFDTFSVVKFGLRYVGKVANPKEIVLFHKKPQYGKNAATQVDAMAMAEVLDGSGIKMERPEVIVTKYFQEADPSAKLSMLTEKGLGEAVAVYIDKDEKDAICQLIDYQMQKTKAYLTSTDVDEEGIDEEIDRYREARQRRKEDGEEVSEAIRRAQASGGNAAVPNGVDEGSDGDGVLSDDGDSMWAASMSTSSTGARGGRGKQQPRGGRGSRGSRGVGGPGSRDGRGVRGRGRGGGSSRANPPPPPAAAAVAEAIDISSGDSDNEITSVRSSAAAAPRRVAATGTARQSQSRLTQFLTQGSQDPNATSNTSSNRPQRAAKSKRSVFLYDSDDDD